jgi:uncharacterized membrane protein
MSTQAAVLTTDIPQAKVSRLRLANKTLNAAAAFWFVVVVLGQVLFAFSVASFYGLAAVRGNWQQWNRTMTHGYSADHPVGNTVVAIHLASAVIIMLSGAVQLIPQVRRRAPRFHRWNGRLYMVTAFSVSLAGLYMMWVRGSVGDLAQHLGQSLDGVLIMVCAVVALRTALRRDFKTHRRWALRLFLVVSASLFIRAGVFLATVVNHGPFGYDPVTLTGPYLTFVTYAQSLLPLAVLEIYLRTQDRARAAGRFAMAAGLFVLTIVLGAGITTVSAASFVPTIQFSLDSRKPIGQALSDTIAAGGIDKAVRQYHQLKAASPTTYNFDEDQLNNLGYELVRAKKLDQAIRIFQLNVEAYPQSANVYDSLGEGYMDAGDKRRSIANYQKSLQLNPKNTGAVKMLQLLNK